jgi:N-acetylglucosaminyl-diphospho-decaprenol L-rhamnosyltransferase
MSGTMAVGVINYNTREHLRRCLASVREESAEQVVVVDNGSDDGSVEMVRRDFPEVRLHLEPTNPGYGAGCNRAMERCSTDFVLLLNSDTELRPGCLDGLAQYLRLHPAVGLAGPRLENPDGSLQRSCHAFPSPSVTLLEMTPLRRVARHVPGVRDRYARTWPHDRARRVDWLTGAALALRRQAFLSVGGFDESYFMYQEEVDLCYRLHAAGWESHFTPAGTIVHVGGASTTQVRTEMAAQHLLSVLRFYDRHHRGTRRTAARAIVKASVVGRWARDAVRRVVARTPGARSRAAEGMAAWGRVLADRGRGGIGSSR